MSFSRVNSSLTLEGLQTRPEGQYLERKGRDSKPTRIANELIGMLNAGGGVLVYGISDEGEIEDLGHAGLSPEIPHDVAPYQKLFHEFIAPPAQIQLEEIYLPQGELIFLFHVEPDYERLFQRKDNEAVYLRVADSNRGPLNRDEVKKLEYNKSIRSFEEELREDFEREDLDEVTCDAYRKAMRFEGAFEELALARNLARKKDGILLFKNAAILLFAKNPEKYIANARVRYIRHEGIERRSGSKFNVVKDETFEMNIPNLIMALKAFLVASLRDYYYLDIEQGRFLKVPEFPEDAWLEAMVNALCHRSYNQQGNPIMLRHFDNRLEISNSGPLPAQVTVENIERERYSRNPRIARVLADMGYVRELNEGVPRIYSSMAEFALSRPEYEDSDGTVTLTLKNKVSSHKETILGEILEHIEKEWSGFNPSQQMLIELLFERHEVTLGEMVSHIGISGQAIRYNLKKLEGAGIIERVSDKIRDSNALYRFRTC